MDNPTLYDTSRRLLQDMTLLDVNAMTETLGDATTRTLKSTMNSTPWQRLLQLSWAMDAVSEAIKDIDAARFLQTLVPHLMETFQVHNSKGTPESKTTALIIFSSLVRIGIYYRHYVTQQLDLLNGILMQTLALIRSSDEPVRDFACHTFMKLSQLYSSTLAQGDFVDDMLRSVPDLIAFCNTPTQVKVN